MSEPFRTTSGEYIRRAMSAWIARRGWTLLIPVLALLFCSLFKPILLITMLMWELIIAPGILAFVYLYHGLSDYAVSELLEHTIMFSDGTLTVTFTDNLRPEKRIKISDIGSVDISNRKITLNMKDNPYDILIIPREALSREEDNDLRQWLQPFFESVD